MNQDDRKLFNSLTATSVDRYLTLNGWNRDFSFRNKNLMVYNRYNQNRRIAIPADETFEDFYVTLEDVLKTISYVENKSISKVIKEMSTVFFDRMEFRIISSLSDDGKLPLEYASSCIEGLKELVLYSACAEQNAQPVCFRVTNSAKAHLGSFKLAQTELGSFIINIDIKVFDETNEQTLLHGYDIPVPIEHKMVERIYKAIEQVDDVVNNQTKVSDITSNGYEVGITANMCDAFLKMRPSIGDIEIDTIFRYSSALTRQPDNLKHVTIQNIHFLAMDEISKIYRDKVSVQEVTISGIIKSLSIKKRDRATEKNIRLVTNIKGGFHTISMSLSDDDYIIACNAHRDEQEVEVFGTLDMSKNLWELTEVKSFRIK